MNTQLQQMMDLAKGVMTGIFITTGKADVGFKQRMALEPGGGEKLLVVGSAHRAFHDGFCVAVLEPDGCLEAQLHEGVGYSEPILKEMVAKHCKAMVMLMSQSGDIFLASKYQAQQG